LPSNFCKPSSLFCMLDACILFRLTAIIILPYFGPSFSYQLRLGPGTDTSEWFSRPGDFLPPVKGGLSCQH
jgi:hypothetical protein